MDLNSTLANNNTIYITDKYGGVTAGKCLLFNKGQDSHNEG